MSNQVMQLDEAALKCLFLEHLRHLRMIDANSILASEYDLGRAGRRIDLAVWSGELIGVEFKSRFDSLRRLSWQLDAYVQCFDRVILVVDQKHTQKLFDVIPAPIELWTVDAFAKFTLVNKAGVIRTQTVEGLANLCSLADLRRISPAGNSSSAYRGRSNILAGDLRLDEVYEAAIKGFKRAFGNSSRSFWKTLGEGSISPETLLTLSRFATQRAQKKLSYQTEQIFWQNWTKQAFTALQTSSEAIN